MILHLYAFAIIGNWDSDKIVIQLFNNQLYYSISVCKLYSVGKKVEENLLEPFHVGFHHKFVWEIVEKMLNFNSFHIDFVL